MRKITDHIVAGDSANHQLVINVTDEPGAGGANHAYRISWGVPVYNTPDKVLNVLGSVAFGFQNGPIKEVGVNGVTQEALLAIVIDRLRSFEKGPLACVENATALEHCEQALDSLQERTRARIRRGVEGTHQK